MASTTERGVQLRTRSMPSSGTKAAEGEDATALKIGRDSKPPIGNLFVLKIGGGEDTAIFCSWHAREARTPPFTTTAKAMTAEWGCIQSVTQTLKRYRGGGRRGSGLVPPHALPRTDDVSWSWDGWREDPYSRRRGTVDRGPSRPP